MARLKRIAVTALAGYQEIVWDGLQADENLLIGRNGAGKSTLLEAVVVGLNYANTKRSGDLLTGANQDAYLDLAFADGTSITKSLGEIRGSQTPVGSHPVENVLYFHEARRPKSRFGRSGRSKLTQHPTRRYEYVLSELQLLLKGDEQEQRWVSELLEQAASMEHAWHPREWEWINKRLPTGSQNAPRPMSCGQFDVLSFLLDAVRTRDAIKRDGQDVFVIIDNPDALLHPALQEELLDLLREILPRAQFFIGTHSLKLLARGSPSAIFWLSRDLADEIGRVQATPIRDLEPDTRRMFFELYGHDTSSAVFAMALGLESTEYFAFLCASAFPCRAITRPGPLEADPQIREIIAELRRFSGTWRLLDVGAGAGDLLVGAERLGVANRAWEYVAVDHDAQPPLDERVADAIDRRVIAPTSRVVADMAEAGGVFDAVVFANTCHALGLERLSAWLAIGIERLRAAPESRLVIHEVEVLQRGEHSFIMWTPEEYLSLFGSLPGVISTELPSAPRAGVPLHTIVVRRDVAAPLPTDLATRFQAGFEAMLAPKFERLLMERTALETVAPELSNLSAAIQGRRRAFVTEQCANIARELHRLGRIPFRSERDVAPATP